MTANEFVAESFKHIINGKQALLAGQFGIEKHLQQKVAQLGGQLWPIAMLDRLQNFISLFQRVLLDGVKCLLPVPGTTSGSAKPGHDGYRVLKFSTCGHNSSIKQSNVSSASCSPPRVTLRLLRKT